MIAHRLFLGRSLTAAWYPKRMMSGGGPECSDTAGHQPAAASTGSRTITPPSALWSVLPRTNLDRPAVVLVEGGLTVSHRELQDLSLSFAAKLIHDLGYGVGDKLALVLGGNYIASVIAQLAAAAAGITVVTAGKIDDNVLEGCRGMVVSANVLQGRLPKGLLEGEKHSAIEADALNAVDYAPLDKALASTDHTLQFAVYGGAKATDRYVTQGEVAALAQSMVSEIGLSDADRVAVPVSLAHSFGFGSGVLATLIAGGTVIVPSAGMDIHKCIHAIKQENATLLFLDRDILKVLQEHNVEIPKTLRKGVLKIGSGCAFNQEPEKFKEYSCVPLVTVGRGLPKRTSW